MLKKIVFMGTPYFAVPILKSLYQNGYNVSAVYTQPPQKSNRGQKINKSPIQNFSETLNIEFRTPKIFSVIVGACGVPVESDPHFESTFFWGGITPS